MRANEIKNEIDDIKKWEENIERKDLKYETNKHMHNFQQFETIRSFGANIFTGKISMDAGKMDQTNLLESMIKFDNESRPRKKENKDKKRNTFDSVNALYEGRELTLNTLRSRIFAIEETQGKGRTRMLVLRPSDLAKRLKVLTPKQMFQRLPIVLAQVKASNTSEKLLNEIGQIIYSLYRAKEITKRVYNNIISSLKL